MSDMDVLVIGRSCLDMIAVVDQFPREDTKTPLLCRMMEGGGQGGTASCCIARLGGKVSYYGHLGADEAGRFCLKRLKDFGVNTEFVEVIQKGKTPVAYIFITRESGRRTIFYEKNTLPGLRVNRLSKMLSHPARVILLDPEVTYLAKDIKAVVKDSARIVYDCERWHQDIPDMMAVADYFIPTFEFLQVQELNFTDLPLDRQMFRLTDMIAGELVVTRGGEGAYYVDKDQLFRVPVPEVEVKDTTGAGDNFHAAFSMALVMGYGLSAAVKFSVAVASLSCREYGGRNGIPDLAEAHERAGLLQERLISTRNIL